MFADFYKTFREETSEEKEEQRQLTIRCAAENHVKFFGKCSTCKHLVLSGDMRHISTIDAFYNWFCELQDTSYRITCYCTCENYQEKPLEEEIKEINASFGIDCSP